MKETVGTEVWVWHMESVAVRDNYSARTDPRVMLGCPVFNSDK